jgi:2-polyprenyl-6-methoxyphenol hydroxylase-like FAD-dependent oxidoreductase
LLDGPYVLGFRRARAARGVSTAFTYQQERHRLVGSGWAGSLEQAGRARLAASPSATGSPLVENTIGSCRSQPWPRAAQPSLVDRSGAVLSRIERPWTAGIWSRVYQPLRAAVPNAIIFPGRAIERVKQGGARVVAHFAGGGTEAGDLLVACDGALSTVRHQFLSEVEPLSLSETHTRMY